MQLLEIGEAERQAVLLCGIAQRGPVQPRHLVAAQAFHADQGVAGNLVAAPGILGQAEAEVPAARAGDRLQLHFLQLQSLPLGVAADQSRVETQVGAQAVELFLALGQGAAQRAGGDFVDLGCPLQVGELLLQVVDLAEQGALLAVVDGGRGIRPPAQRSNDQTDHQQAAEPGQTQPQPAPAMADVVVPAHDKTRWWS